MKRLLSITLCVAAFCFATNGYAQKSKVENFIDKYSHEAGASYVEMSKTMLTAAFEPKNNNDRVKNSFVVDGKKKYPQKYKSIVFNDTTKSAEIKKILNDPKYEVLLDMRSTKHDRKTNENYLQQTMYYFYSTNVNSENEIVIIQQNGNRNLSVTYMQGDLIVDMIQNYLLRIRLQSGQLDG